MLQRQVQPWLRCCAWFKVHGRVWFRKLPRKYQVDAPPISCLLLQSILIWSCLFHQLPFLNLQLICFAAPHFLQLQASPPGLLSSWPCSLAVPSLPPAANPSPAACWVLQCGASDVPCGWTLAAKNGKMQRNPQGNQRKERKVR